MSMHNPPHPGEFIQEIYMEPFSITGRQLAAKLDVAPSTLNRILKGSSGISSEMALRLSKTLGRSPESWLMLQDSFNGMLIESEDLLIAATALANQMKLATGNVKHFNRIDGLELV